MLNNLDSINKGRGLLINSMFSRQTTSGMFSRTAGFQPIQITPSQWINFFAAKRGEIYSNKKGFKFNDLKPFYFLSG